ncbi:MAG: hypothetical protein IJ129_04580 [Ruminococcus sp.]|nr:hypothetical protein [Ruminococcus sp.]
MTSNVYTLSKLGEDEQNIPAEAERVARYNDLDEKSVLRLRLLSEELICMLPRLLIYGEGKFWIENNGKDYELHLTVDSKGNLDYDTEKVLGISKSGKNAAAKGIVSRISVMIENMMKNRARMLRDDPYGVMSKGLSDYSEDMVWTLNEYRSNFEHEDVQSAYKEEWDELERSIIANLADDVIVGIKKGIISIVVKKKF